MRAQTRNVVAGGVALALVFQFFLRYEYVHLAGGRVMRIDRATGSSCFMPCTPPPPAPTPTPYDPKVAIDDFLRADEEQDQDAILLVKATAKSPTGTSVADLVRSTGPQFAWTAQPANSNDAAYVSALKNSQSLPALSFATPTPGSTLPPPPPLGTPTPINLPHFQTRLACYCDPKGDGWRWEVHVDTRAVYYVNDNADLMRKYGLTRGKN